MAMTIAAVTADAVPNATTRAKSRIRVTTEE
jgi:hypothetical protein